MRKNNQQRNHKLTQLKYKDKVPNVTHNLGLMKLFNISRDEF